MATEKAKFSEWLRWEQRESENNKWQGVYLLAHFDRCPSGAANHLSERIVYIGAAPARKLQKRWDNFDKAASRGSKNIHSGGETYHRLFGKPQCNLYVAACPVKETSKILTSVTVLYLERKLILDYVLKHGRRPECNKE